MSKLEKLLVILSHLREKEHDEMPDYNDSTPPGGPRRKRQSIRFKPEPGSLALIDIEPGRGSFKPEVVALVLEEAAKGCGLVVTGRDAIRLGEQCVVQVGELAPIKAEVRWRKELDPQVHKIGLMYLK